VRSERGKGIRLFRTGEGGRGGNSGEGGSNRFKGSALGERVGKGETCGFRIGELRRSSFFEGGKGFEMSFV
jgi:hypothetical protein